MILKDDLYKIQNCTETDEGFTYSVGLNAGCFIYKAHFPGNPITPGVCILQILTELLQEHLGKALEVQTINNVKYLAVISPTEQATVDYVFSSPVVSDDTVKAKVVVRNENGAFAKISVTYRTA